MGEEKAGGAARGYPEWMPPLCTVDRGGVTDAPWTSSVDGVRYLVASNGHGLVGLIDATPAPDGPDIMKVWNPRDWTAVSLAALRAWALDGRKPLGGKCVECDGEGYTQFAGVAFDSAGDGPYDDLYEKCGGCRGGRFMTRRKEAVREGLLLGAPVNRNLVADYTEHVKQQEMVLVSTNGDADNPCSFIRGDGWIVAVMGYRGGSGPAFPPEEASTASAPKEPPEPTPDPEAQRG